MTHTVAVGALAGFVAGMIVGGIGSRIAMRIVAITAGSADQGAITEAEEVVGEITFGGTFFLMIFGAFVGVPGGLIYLAVRRWVADSGRWRGLLFGFLLLAMFGWAIVEGDNSDFHLFGSPLLNIAIFASLFILFGLLIAPLFERVERALPPPSLRPTGLISLAAHGFGHLLLLLTPFIVVGIAFGFGDRPAVFGLLPAYVVFVVPITAALLSRMTGRFERLSDLRQHQSAMGLAFAVLALPVVAGLVLDARAVADIFKSG